MMLINGWSISRIWEYAKDYEIGDYTMKYMSDNNFQLQYDPAYNFRIDVVIGMAHIIKDAVWMYSPDEVTVANVLRDIEPQMIRNRLLEDGFNPKGIYEIVTDKWLKMMMFEMTGALVLKRQKVRNNTTIDEGELNDQVEFFDDDCAILGGNPCVFNNRTFKGLRIYDHITAINSFRYGEYYRRRYDHENYRYSYSSGYSAVMPDETILSSWSLYGIKDMIRNGLW